MKEVRYINIEKKESYILTYLITLTSLRAFYMSHIDTFFMVFLYACARGAGERTK